MGTTLSKVWGRFLTAWTGGGSANKKHQDSANGHLRDVENNFPTTNTTAKHPTPLPSMYEITEVCLECDASRCGLEG
jgi:hypothetical protein